MRKELQAELPCRRYPMPTLSIEKENKNTVPLLDENEQQVISKYGKPMFRKSYSVLQDKLFAHMTEAGFTGCRSRCLDTD